MKTILSPIDFSGITDSVMGQTITLAQALGSRVVLMNVLQPPVIASEYGPFVDNLNEIMVVGEKASAKRLTQLQEQLAQAGLESEVVQVTGTPVANILTQAEKLNADYIVMGSHGHTAFYDLLVGSTTHGVLLRAKCPVIIVPAEKAAQK